MVYKTNDSMLPWVCSEIDHRRRQNVVDLLNILQTWLECSFFTTTECLETVLPTLPSPTGASGSFNKYAWTPVKFNYLFITYLFLPYRKYRCKKTTAVVPILALCQDLWDGPANLWLLAKTVPVARVFVPDDDLEVTLLKNTFKPLLTWKYAEYQLGWSGALLMYSADSVRSRKKKVTKGRAKLLPLTPLYLVILDIACLFSHCNSRWSHFSISRCRAVIRRYRKVSRLKYYELIFLHLMVALRHFTTVF